MKKGRIRLVSALALFAACLFFVGAFPFLCVDGSDGVDGQVRLAGETVCLTAGDEGRSIDAGVRLAGETARLVDAAVRLDGAAELTMDAAVRSDGDFADWLDVGLRAAGGQERVLDGLDGGVHMQSSGGRLGAVDMVIGQSAVRGAAAGVSGARNTKNMRGFFMSLLILYMIANTLIFFDKSCFYVKNQRSFFYIRYSLILLNVIHQADGKHRQLHSMAKDPIPGVCLGL